MDATVRNATPTKNNALKAVGISDSPNKAQNDLENYVSSLKTTLNNLKKQHNHQSLIVKRSIAMSLRSVRKAKIYNKSGNRNEL